MDPEISAQLAVIEKHIETESQGTKKSESLQDQWLRFEDFPAEILLKLSQVFSDTIKKCLYSNITLLKVA